jgi:hypothetical protein
LRSHHKNAREAIFVALAAPVSINPVQLRYSERPVSSAAAPKWPALCESPFGLINRVFGTRRADQSKALIDHRLPGKRQRGAVSQVCLQGDLRSFGHPGKYKPAAGEPKVWFTSAESFARVLSDRNRDLLGIIADPSLSRLPAWLN